jgi:hypothetical protein
MLFPRMSKPGLAVLDHGFSQKSDLVYKDVSGRGLPVLHTDFVEYLSNTYGQYNGRGVSSLTCPRENIQILRNRKSSRGRWI